MVKKQTEWKPKMYLAPNSRLWAAFKNISRKHFEISLKSKSLETASSGSDWEDPKATKTKFSLQQLFSISGLNKILWKAQQQQKQHLQK